MTHVTVIHSVEPVKRLITLVTPKLRYYVDHDRYETAGASYGPPHITKARINRDYLAAIVVDLIHRTQNEEISENLNLQYLVPLEEPIRALIPSAVDDELMMPGLLDHLVYAVAFYRVDGTWHVDAMQTITHPDYSADCAPLDVYLDHLYELEAPFLNVVLGNQTNLVERAVAIREYEDEVLAYLGTYPLKELGSASELRCFYDVTDATHRAQAVCLPRVTLSAMDDPSL